MIPPNEPILTSPSETSLSDPQESALHPATDPSPTLENHNPSSASLDESFYIEGSVDPDLIELPPEASEPEPKITSLQPCEPTEPIASQEAVACKTPLLQATPIENNEFELLQSKRPDPCMILERMLHSFRIPTSLPAEPLSDEAFPFD